MNEHHYAHLTARLLRAARARIGPHPSALPADAVAELASVIRSTAGRRDRRRLAISIAAAATVVCIAVTVGWTPIRSNRPTTTTSIAVAATDRRPISVAEGTAGATVVAAGGIFQPLVAGHEWRSGEELRTAERSVALSMQGDGAIEVEPHSDLQLVRADVERWLRLGRGAVEVHVAKLKSGERFVIATPDAEVEVRGTRFRVAVVPSVAECGQGTVTRVSVTEGVVVVRSLGGQSRVEAGRGWPTDCAERSSSVAPRQLTTLRGEPKRQVSLRTPATRSSTVDGASGVSVSTLATENDLFGAALKAESAGDRRSAVQLLNVLLDRFPASPLKETATVERARLIGSTQSAP